MKRPGGRALIETWVAAVSALLLGLVLPSAAQGSCGDYLHRVPAPPGAESKADVPPPPAPHAPCQGPSCSRHDNDPPAPAPQAPPSSDDSAQLSAALALPGHDGGELLVLSASPSPAHLLGSIYRPPRFLSR